MSRQIGQSSHRSCGARRRRGSLGLLPRPPCIAQGGKPYAGTTLNAVVLPDHLLRIPARTTSREFEEKTGIKVNFTMQAFPVYNQRTDLELSTKGSALDVCNVTFIYSGRWIGAGWFTNLDNFIKDANTTPADWDAGGFRRRPAIGDEERQGRDLRLRLGSRRHDHGRGARRPDREGRASSMPTTFDELIKVCEAVHNKDGVAAFIADKLHHWNWIPYLMGLGGSVFKAPPDNLTPTLDTPEAADVGRMVRQPADEVRARRRPVLSPTTRRCARRCRAAPTSAPRRSPGWCRSPSTPESKVQKTVRYGADAGRARAATSPAPTAMASASRPAPRRRRRRGSSSTGRCPRRPSTRIVKEHGYPARLPQIGDHRVRQFTKSLTLNGQDVAPLYLQVLELGGKTGYMKYRTVPVLPAGRRQDQQGDGAHRHQAAGCAATP